MNNKVLFLFLVMFLISFSSAFELKKIGYDWDNEGQFKKDILTSKYGKYEIRNAVLGLSWFQLGKVADIELINNSDICLEDCFAEKEITLYEDGILVDEITFETLQEDGSWIYQPIRSYQFSYEKNGETIIYNEGDVVEAGTYILRLEGSKKPLRTVDWKIKSNGIWTDEWAVWGGGFIGDEYQLIVYADSWDESNLEINNVTVTNISSGIFKINTSETNDDLSRAQIMKTLFYGSSGTDPRATSTYITNPTLIYSNDVRDNDMKGYYTKISFNQRTTGYMELSLTDTIYNATSWGFATCTAANSCGSQDIKFNGTTIRTFPSGGTSYNYNDLGTTSYSNNESIITVRYTGGDVSAGDVTTLGGIILTKSNVSSSYTRTYCGTGCGETTITTDFLINESFPVFTFVEGEVTLNSPVNSYISPTIGVQFNATAIISGGANLTNMSLWTNETGSWAQRNITTSLTENISTQTWTRTYLDGDHILWNVQACDTDGDCGFSTLNRTTSIDISPSTITIESPSGTLDYGTIGEPETLNVTFTDANLDSCWYNYNGTNITIDGCLTGVKNSTSFTLEADNLNMTIYANDSVGNENSSFISWDYKILETNQTYNSITTEGATEQFTINFTKTSDDQVSTVDLIYNGSSNSFSYSTSGNNVIATGSIVIPTVNSDTNFTFYWNITLDDDSSIATTSNNQTVSNINIDDCSSYTNLIYNFTQYDEENQSTLSNNNTIELQINLYDEDVTASLINFSDEFTDVNPVQFCAEDPILTTVNYSAYVIVKYYVNNTDTNQSYSVEYYNILNQTIGNTTIPKNIALYNLKTSDTTKFRLTFRDDEYVLAPNILVQVHRQYIKDNDFKVVEIPITDSNGQTILNLVKDNIVYNFIMVDESGDIVGTFNSIKAFCADFSIGDCTINLAPDSASEDAYDYNEEFDISISDPSYDNSTKKISMSFVTGDLSPKTVRMEIVRNNQFGNRSVCYDSLLAASGILSCDVSAITDTDQFLFISTFVEDDLAKQDTTNLNNDILNFGTLNGAFYAFLLILFLITMFMEDKKVLVASLGLGWVAIISLGLVNGKLIGFTSAGIWILISIAIFLWKLNNEEST